MGRGEEIAYALQHSIPVKQQADKPYSYDENMWGNTGEGGESRIRNWSHHSRIFYNGAQPLSPQADAPESIDIEFIQGVPKKLNGTAMK